MMDYETLERAAFNAWPAIEQKEYQGLVIRYANGYTKRANSANLLKLDHTDFESLTEHVEHFFTQRKEPTIFRIPSYTQSEKYDEYLGNRGYQKQSLTLVLNCPLTADSAKQENRLKGRSVEVVSKCADKWLESYCLLSGQSLDHQSAHLSILEKIECATFFALLKINGEVVACGLGVVENEMLGIFDVLTRQQDRGKGYATYLLREIFSWALTVKATSSYLQVVAENNSAINLYHKLGYQQRYQYWYRSKDCC
jgi:GNAT superfamily N-acetyltransferase